MQEIEYRLFLEYKNGLLESLNKKEADEVVKLQMQVEDLQKMLAAKENEVQELQVRLRLLRLERARGGSPSAEPADESGAGNQFQQCAPHWDSLLVDAQHLEMTVLVKKWLEQTNVRDVYMGFTQQNREGRPSLHEYSQTRSIKVSSNVDRFRNVVRGVHRLSEAGYSVDDAISHVQDMVSKFSTWKKFTEDAAAFSYNQQRGGNKGQGPTDSSKDKQNTRKADRQDLNNKMDELLQHLALGRDVDM